MTAHPDDERLNDWVEGVLDGSERAALDDHIDSCDSCRERAEALRRLLADLRALPREVSPGADLRPAIRAQVRRRSEARALRRLRGPLAAAAALLVVGTATLTALVVRALDDDGASTPDAPTALLAEDRAAVAELRALEREYGRAAEDLLAALERARSELPPGTARLVEQNVAVVERALAESRAALEEDPASPVLRELVLAAHRQRLDVLRRAMALALGT